PNGGLEEAEAGATTADPWFLGASSGSAEFSVIDSVAHSGSKCLFINVIEKYTGNFWDIQAVYEHIAVSQAAYYRATFYARSTSGYTFRAAIGTYNNYAELTNATFTVGKDWTRVALVCYNPDQDELRVTISAFEAGHYYIDDMSLIESPIAGATVVPTGDSIIIQTISGIDASSNFDPSSFTVTVDGTEVPVEKVTIVPRKTNQLALIMSNTILPNQKVEISHVGGKIFYTNTNNLPDDNLIAFSDEAFNLSKASANNITTPQASQIRIFPNPAADYVSIALAHPISSVEIYSLSGQLVSRLKNPSATLDVSNLSSGSYIMFVEDTQGTRYRSRLVKK
ncbi:MAG: T9SS type A sorting domain-containing protein, partial [Bacteroidales bacterium]